MASEDLPALPLPPDITEFYLSSHDLTYHILSSGNRNKPLILCLHGFPELAFSWRKIMPSIAAEGYHVVAYDQRGYGRTTGWDTRPYSEVNLNTFTFTRLVRDAVIFVNALGYKEVACAIGHDFGAMVASMCALTRPDLFKSAVIMSHPFKGSPSLPFDTVRNPITPRQTEDIHQALTELPEPRKHYKWYYSTATAASEMDNPKESLGEFLRGYFHLKSASWDGNNPKPLKAWEATELAQLPYYYIMPLNCSMRQAVQLQIPKDKITDAWLPDSDLSVYETEFQRTGFQGGLNWYRVATNPEYMKDVELFAGKNIDVPCLFIAGKQDWGTYQEPGAIGNMDQVCSKFYGVEYVDNAGHWVQQEQPERVSELLASFLWRIRVDAISH